MVFGASMSKPHYSFMTDCVCSYFNIAASKSELFILAHIRDAEPEPDEPELKRGTERAAQEKGGGNVIVIMRT